METTIQQHMRGQPGSLQSSGGLSASAQKFTPTASTVPAPPPGIPIGKHIQGLALKRVNDLIDNIIMPCLNEKMEKRATQGYLSAIYTADDINLRCSPKLSEVSPDEIKAFFSDPNKIEILINKLSQQDLTATQIMLDNRRAIQVSWAPGAESDEGSDEEEPFMLDEKPRFQYRQAKGFPQTPIAGSPSKVGFSPRGRGRGNRGRGRGLTSASASSISPSPSPTMPRAASVSASASPSPSPLLPRVISANNHPLQPQIQPQQPLQQPKPQAAAAPEASQAPSTPPTNPLSLSGEKPVQPVGIQGPSGKFRGIFMAGFPAPGELPQTLQDFLKAVPAEAIVIENWARKRLVLVGDKQPLDKALTRLNRHRITGIPVLNEDTRNVRGVLDVGDVVRMMCDVVFEPNLSSSPPSSPSTPTANHNNNQPSSLVSAARWEFSLKQISTLMQHTKRPMMVGNQASLYDILQLLANGSRRVLVVDKDIPQQQQQEGQEISDVIGLVCQIDILRFLAQNVAWLHKCPYLDTPIKDVIDLDSTVEKLCTVSCEVPAFAAFKKMVECNAAGVAVVDNDNKLVATLSESNIRGISRRNFQVLSRNVADFLQRDRRVGWWYLPVYIKPSDTFGKVLLLFVASGLHRIHLIDDNGHPTHTITLTDILKRLL